MFFLIRIYSDGASLDFGYVSPRFFQVVSPERFGVSPELFAAITLVGDLSPEGDKHSAKTITFEEGDESPIIGKFYGGVCPVILRRADSNAISCLTSSFCSFVATTSV